MDTTLITLAQIANQISKVDENSSYVLGCVDSALSVIGLDPFTPGHRPAMREMLRVIGEHFKID